MIGANQRFTKSATFLLILTTRIKDDTEIPTKLTSWCRRNSSQVLDLNGNQVSQRSSIDDVTTFYSKMKICLRQAGG
ncbi:uncharacterized protein PHALS_12379 [Plasmopara halstedii]|uniref:Uncharacterized protein n=1 Tax=Plasmopara halstedii TaxID=4781 RepID=A0A0P1AM32_PLAHL|nr:uncharacterized protein PHALS_12379 [Plasmopara halstedii]CEG42073.1 hypothetical protein PHALS_12379 [Plasmopara halstedii]|eukprot:XP_024578442.1 hypothetical protein PHALS_12379 [Plasmopara halstedii]